MYNRYVRNDAGRYERVSTEEKHTSPTLESKPEHPLHSAPISSPGTSVDPGQSSPLAGLLGKGGLLSGILDKLKLSDIDTGDLLLLVLLFLLFRDGEDDELLIALGLLLIL